MLNFEAMNPEHRKKWLEKRKNRQQDMKAEVLLPALLSGDRSALSKAITLLESTASGDQIEAKSLLRSCLPHSGKSIRIGITGVPGVGKSSFIEVFGQWLIEQGHQLAVLAIDPSSATNGGSILGDKTRMQELSANPKAFVRPSPAGASLGGVARKTRESVLLCEAAGFDIILIETVGVGQSEILVHSMVDFFLLLMLAGAGDELQGIKRGIMELSDLLIVNKAEGENKSKAQLAARSYQNALHLFPPNPNGWTPKTMISSSIEAPKMNLIWEQIEKFWKHTTENGSFQAKRARQEIKWFQETVIDRMFAYARESKEARQDQVRLEEAITEGKISPFEAADEWVKKWIVNH